MVPATALRVHDHTAPHLNAHIRKDIERRLANLQQADRSALITQRLAQLEREWDVERSLQTNFAAVSLAALGLAGGVSRGWYALAFAVPAFMVQHALQGWCPPLSVLRRMGVRTAREINDERFALKCLRGDFDRLGPAPAAGELIDAVRR